ncbi:hypothetical protein BDZ89DRAFT_1062443, partial [Hymenopellis radicata]
MFDLGLRSDIAQLPPAFQAELKAMEPMGAKMTSGKDVATQLREGGIEPESVNAVVWRYLFCFELRLFFLEL